MEKEKERRRSGGGEEAVDENLSSAVLLLVFRCTYSLAMENRDFVGQFSWH